MDYILAFSSKHGIVVGNAKDNYAAPVLLKTDIMIKMCDTLNAEINKSAEVPMFVLFNE